MTIVLLEQGSRQAGISIWMRECLCLITSTKNTFEFSQWRKIKESIRPCWLVAHAMCPLPLKRSLASSITKSSQRSKHSLLHSFSWSKLHSQRFPLSSGCFFFRFPKQQIMMKKEKHCEREKKYHFGSFGFTFQPNLLTRH